MSITKFPTKQNVEMSAGTLYDMNKQIMQDRKPLSHLELAAIQPKVEDWFNKYEALRHAHHAGHGLPVLRSTYSTCSMPGCMFSSPVRQHSFPNELHFPQLYDQDKPSSQMPALQPQIPVH